MLLHSVLKRSSTRLLAVVFLPALMAGQSPQAPAEPPVSPAPVQAQTLPCQPGQPARKTAEQQRAEEELRQQKKQRILGVIPNFNTSNVQNAATLSPRQKFSLAFKSALDPFEFAAAAADAGLSQWENEYPGYGQGAQGYGKRLGASYADNFYGTLLGGAVFPVLLHQDPRYFRKGSGSFKGRLFYAISTTVICKGDNGKWQPNYSNVLGNIAAGGISNLYYPSTDRGAGLTFERATTVTAEGAIGAVFVEFWPDISKKVFRGRQ
jgi:hypothetical protein